MTTRRNYTDQFKADAVNLVEQEGYALAEVARRLGVNRSCLARWRREGYGASNSSPAAAKADEQELRRLREEVRKLRIERDILKNRLRGLPHPIRIETHSAILSYSDRGRLLFGG